MVFSPDHLSINELSEVSNSRQLTSQDDEAMEVEITADVPKGTKSTRSGRFRGRGKGTGRVLKGKIVKRV